MRVSLLTCLILTLNLLSPLTQGQTPPVFPAATSAPTKLSNDESYGKEPYIYELIQSAVHFEPDGKGHRDLILRVRIQSESAVHEFGLLVYSFSSKFESLEVIYARVRKPDGTVVETPASDIQERDSAVSREAPMYTYEREKQLAIKSLSVGDSLEAHFRWTVHDRITPGHFLYDHSYLRDSVCHH